MSGQRFFDYYYYYFRNILGKISICNFILIFGFYPSSIFFILVVSWVFPISSWTWMMRTVILICISVVSLLWWRVKSSPPLPPSCPISTAYSEILPIIFPGILDHCPLSSKPRLPLEVNGGFIEKVLSSKWSNRHISVLFYASWCPFSMNARSLFEVLSNMYPEVEHFAVEYSSILPRVFSRYRIHRLPSIFMLNETSVTRFHGPKDLTSFIKFYKETTGLEPERYINFNQPDISGTSGNYSMMQSWVGASIDEIWRREPYVLVCTLFLCIRVILYMFPRIFHRVKAAWESYQPNFNMEIFGETRQMLERIFQLINVERAWNKVKSSKIWNLRSRANNARVWASSSFASVSLGETTRSSFVAS